MVKIDASHFYAAINQLSRAGYTLLMLALVPLTLDKAGQGYWFSFMSLSALMIIADSGFSTIILQFAAHEFAFLRFGAAGAVEGEGEHLKRLGSFLRFSLRWSSGVVLVAMPVIAAAGWYIMSGRPAEADWRLPWLLYVLGSVLTFMNNTLLYFFEGCDSVAKSQKIRAQVFLVMIAVLAGGLLGGFKLYALSLAALASALVGAARIYSVFGRAAAGLLAEARGYAHSWRREFLPLLGRYSLSWASGYFIFQMYTPIMFHYYGPVEAGKIGISITLWTGALTFSNIWLSVVTPKMNIHVSKKEWQDLDRLFFRNLGLSAGTFLAGAACVFAFLLYGQGRFAIAERFVSPLSMLFLAGGWWLQVVVNGLAIYLRAHKEEPLVVPSVATALYIVAATYLSARYLAADYFFLGFFSSYVWGLPWVIWIFNKKRRDGHLDEQPYAPAYNSNTDV
jgi:hypothetical protein